MVEMKPQIIAEGAIVAMAFPLDGAKAESTPIWIPSDPLGVISANDS
jgi:hypothetical protein